jgi:hypothetical protein
MATKKLSRSRDAELLQKYVATFRTWDDQIVFEYEAPPPELVVAMRPECDDDYTRWQAIRCSTLPAAVEALERALPGSLPSLYRELVLSYRYLEVELGRYRLLANPPSEGLDGLREAMFRDQFLFPTLLHHGYIQFGRGPDYNYDPVCFNAAGRRHNGELEVVRLDHEQILCYERIKIVERLAGSFRELVEETIERSQAAVRRRANHGA